MAPAYIPALDGIRGLAILMVLVFHLSFYGPDRNPILWATRWVASLGWCGVDLFLVLSGFLITRILLAARGGPHYYRDFYARRTLRIFPLYYGLLILCLVVLPAFGVDRWSEASLGRSRIWLWFYGSNFVVALNPAEVHLGFLWSLAVEEHFYLFWPALVALCGRRTLGRICVAIILVSPLIRLAVFKILGPIASYILTPCRLDGVALGAFLAVLERDPGGLARLANPARRVLVAAGAGLLSLLLWRGGLRFSDPATNVCGLTLLAAFFGAMLVLVVSATPGSPLSAAFLQPALRWLGKYSYAAYLFNWIVREALLTVMPIEWLRARLGSPALADMAFLAAGMSLTLSAAWLSWHLYERQFLGLKRLFGGPAGVPTAGAIARPTTRPAVPAPDRARASEAGTGCAAPGLDGFDPSP